MEWSKDKTLKLIELLQLNANLWNPSLCDTRRDKQKRKEELRGIADILNISVSDATKKIQHLRTQYNRESAREARSENECYISNWYAYEYLHFMKDSNKPYRVLLSDNQDINITLQGTENSASECKLDNLPTPSKIARTDLLHSFKPDIVYPANRDEFSVFGEYVANELRSLKGEKNLLVAKKKIQDVIFEVKMGMINEPRVEQAVHTCTVYTPSSQSHTSIHNGKLYTTPIMSTIPLETLTTSQNPPTTGISEIIINGACHYSTFKVDEQ
ncbi:uncharacterized protein LOC123881196 [Maniola jurtina]|uniref:uncharacterized protein LOC123881196 n=1 Tax=Maniola jurtina TaxID=191418 RepID=UPI001E688015|nr:uncharacterized protein LOC123881196 [Maniola jurtina]